MHYNYKFIALSILLFNVTNKQKLPQKSSEVSGNSYLDDAITLFFDNFEYAINTIFYAEPTKLVGLSGV